MTVAARRATRIRAARPAEGVGDGAPSLGVAPAQSRDPAHIGLDIFFHAEPCAIRKCRREATIRAYKGEALREKAVFVRGKELWAGKQADVHGVKIVTKAWPGDFTRFDRTAGNVGAFDNDNLPAVCGEMQSGRQTIDAGADHDRIVGHSFAPA
jgi:hypothetical protein